MIDDYSQLDDGYMAKVIVDIINREVERSTRSFIEAEANVAAQKVRVNYAEKEDENDGPGPISKGSQSRETLRRYEVTRDASDKDLYRWRQIYRHAISTFLEKLK